MKQIIVEATQKMNHTDRNPLPPALQQQQLFKGLIMWTLKEITARDLFNSRRIKPKSTPLLVYLLLCLRLSVRVHRVCSTFLPALNLMLEPCLLL